MTGRVFTLGGAAAFADSLALGLLKRCGDDPLRLSAITLLLPTRRSCRTMREAFLRAAQGKPLLLPHMVPVGDPDPQTHLSLAQAEAQLAPAVEPLHRHLILTRLVMACGLGDSPSLPPDQASQLAAALAEFLDEVQTQRLDFSALDHLAPQDYAVHWQESVRFLSVLSQAWPGVLHDLGRMDPAERRNRILAMRCDLWRENPPLDPIIAAGITGSIPSVADLLRVVAELPQGEIILPGLDLDLDEESWQLMEETHPQHALRSLLRGMELDRKDIRPWPDAPDAAAPRATLWAEVMRPAALTDAWKDGLNLTPKHIQGLTRMDLDDPHEEARVIALILREALETPHRTAALVTLDRGLARRVAAMLRRWQIEVDDSAGTPLSTTSTGAFLRLVADWAREQGPLEFLALMKHPLASAGLSPAQCRRHIRKIETAILRGPRLNGGIATMRRALLEADPTYEELAVWLECIEQTAQPFVNALNAPRVTLLDCLAAHLSLAEMLAGSDDTPGTARLWRGESGEAAATFCSDLDEAVATFPEFMGAAYPALFESLLSKQVVRPRFGKTPRLSILGPLEARLIHADVMVLGGMNETVWPPATESGPWMSRPMRLAFGLQSPETRIGLAAHDFVCAASAPCVVLTRSRKSGKNPALPSRWLQRLDAVLLAASLTLDSGQNWRDLARRIDSPSQNRHRDRPAPKPPVAARPRRLSVTDIETWIADPYALYVKRILNLRELDEIDADPDARILGTLVHKTLELFIRQYMRGHLPPDADQRLIRMGEEVMADVAHLPGIQALWKPRLAHMADWFVSIESARRSQGTWPLAIETKGQWHCPELKFTLTCKADRIDRLASGALAILDYKTGTVPSAAAVARFEKPQLLLEAAIALHGGFADLAHGGTGGHDEIGELAYWKLPSRIGNGKASHVGHAKQANPSTSARECLDFLRQRIAQYDRLEQGYRASSTPQSFGESAAIDLFPLLSRAAEWSD